MAGGAVKRALIALALLASACGTRKLVDPNCQEYVALPGVPCLPGTKLYTNAHFPATCDCEHEWK